MPNEVLVKGLIEHTPSQIEDRATSYLRGRVDLVLRQLPVDVEFLLDNTPNVVIEPLSGLMMRHSVQGCVCKEFLSPKLTVYVDRKLMNGLDDSIYNAVLAEELAHIELQRCIFQQIESIDDFIQVRMSPEWHRIEVEALNFSLAIRMPASTIAREAEAAYAAVVREYGFGPSVPLKVCNRMAMRYRVPIEDMNRRLSRWPCEGAYDCINASNMSRSDSLLSVRAIDGIKIALRQSLLYGHDFA